MGLENLCEDCKRATNDSEYSQCPVAKRIYELAEKSKIKIAVTKCEAANELGTLMYVPIKE